MTTINITNQDIDALSRLMKAEADSIVTFYTQNGYSLQTARDMAYGVIIDTIINRVASNAWYGNSIQDVINKPWQYTPVQEAGGHWNDLPSAGSSIKNYVENYIEGRIIDGRISSVGSATHYYNPTRANPSWGPTMQNKKISGDPAYQSATGETETHIIGNPVGDARPNGYTLSFNGYTHSFGIPDVPPPKPKNPSDGVDDASDGFGNAQDAWDPLTLDLDGDGTIALNTENVYFDIDGDGFGEAIQLINPNDGFLVNDLNNIILHGSAQ